MHGIGNDFVLIDGIKEPLPNGDLNEIAKRLCDRHFGIGADGIILVERRSDVLAMRMFNPDGSESEMCGNGLRTFARYCADEGYATGAFPVVTGAGTLETEVHSDSSVSVNMGKAILEPQGIGMVGVSGSRFVNEEIGGGLRGTAISMGNPHLVVFASDVSLVDLAHDGKTLEHHPFFPHRTNVHFVQIVSEMEIIQKTWERGAGATLACGTGACASAVASFLNGKTGREVTVHLPGGDLFIRYEEDGTVWMRGSAEYSFSGTATLG